MKLIAHRAGTERYPEQSMMAARDSLSRGADFAEIDVRLTADRIPVICHDANVMRIYGVDRVVEEMTLDEFLCLRQTKDPAMATYTLEMALKNGIVPALLHIKRDPIEDLPLILDVIARCGAQNKVIMGVGNPLFVERIKAFDARIGVLAFMHALEDMDAFLATPCDIIRLWEPWLTQERIDRVHAGGKQAFVMSGTFDTVGYTRRENLKLWRDMGADGILVNEIIWAQTELEEATP